MAKRSRQAVERAQRVAEEGAVPVPARWLQTMVRLSSPLVRSRSFDDWL
jgi:hypothetical protein